MTSLLLAVALIAQQDPAAFAELSERRLRADVTFLASEPLDGRLSLRNGSSVAVEWIASEFLKAGLKPAANDGSYLQPVPLLEYRIDSEKTGLTVDSGGKRYEFKTGKAGFNFPAPFPLKARRWCSRGLEFPRRSWVTTTTQRSM